MSKFFIINVWKKFVKEMKKTNKDYKIIFRKSWIFLLFLIIAILLVRAILVSFLLALLTLIILEFFNWLAGKHD